MITTKKELAFYKPLPVKSGTVINSVTLSQREATFC